MAVKKHEINIKAKSPLRFLEQVKVHRASALVWWPYLSYYRYWFSLHQTWMMHLVILMHSTDFDAKYEHWFWVLEEVEVLEQLC